MKSLDTTTENAVRRFLDLISKHYDMVGAIVYGSRARGDYREDSDADVAVLLGKVNVRFWDILMDMSDTACGVLRETGILISPLPIRTEDWEHPENYSNPDLLHNIAVEGVRV
jgi:predicted nucleotidyltransferase